MKESSNIFKVLSDKNRLRILKMLQYRPLCVCEITSILKLAPSTISQHLSLLKKAGFITEHREGRWNSYSINRSPEDERITAILTSLDFWIADLNEVDSDRSKLKSVSKFLLTSK